MRPVIVPAARRLWRGPQALQIGHPAAPALVLTGLSDRTCAVLTLLDGTRTRDEVLTAAAAAGAVPGEAEELLALLDSAGLLVDAGALHAGLEPLGRAERDRLAPDLGCLTLVHRAAAAGALSARRHARVRVQGAGRLGGPLAMLLAASGVGAVDVHDPAPATAADVGVGGLTTQDVGRPRGAALRDRIAQLSPSTQLDARLPDLVVLAEPAPGEAELLARAGVPHLRVSVVAQRAVVGPLVLPGRTACTHCLDLTRTDLDPQWPALDAQLAVSAQAGTSVDGVLAVAAAAQAALQVLEQVEGRTAPATLDGTLELTLPDWRWRRRSWSPHDACPCAWAGAREAG